MHVCMYVCIYICICIYVCVFVCGRGSHERKCQIREQRRRPLTLPYVLVARAAKYHVMLPARGPTVAEAGCIVLSTGAGICTENPLVGLPRPESDGAYRIYVGWNVIIIHIRSKEKSVRERMHFLPGGHQHSGSQQSHNLKRVHRKSGEGQDNSRLKSRGIHLDRSDLNGSWGRRRN